MDYRRIKKIMTGALVLIFSSFLAITVFADNLPVAADMGLPFQTTEETTQENATGPIIKIIKEAIKYVGLLAILAISWGGIQFLVSYGNDEKVKKAKQTITYALIGVLLSVFAYTIVDIVNSVNVIPK